MIQTSRSGNQFSIRTDDPARVFIFVPNKVGIGLLASRRDPKGTVLSITGQVERNDIIELVTYLLTYIMGTNQIDESGIIQ